MTLTTAAAQAPRLPPEPAFGTGTAIVSGVVFDGVTQQPIGGAVVRIRASDDEPTDRVARQSTDDRGRFIFEGLPAGEHYFVDASTFGYFDGGYGIDEHSDALEPIALAEGAWFQKARIPLYRPASLGGRVLDEFGEPMVGAPVRAWARALVSGLPRLVTGPSATTDDRGVYRIAGLRAGAYVIAAAADPVVTSTRREAYPVLFYPAGRSVSMATVIELGAGEARQNLDLVREPEAAFSILGHVDGPFDARSTVLRLVPAGSEDTGTGAEAALTMAGADGSFHFANVPAGDYTILVTRGWSALTIDSSLAHAQPPGVAQPVLRQSSAVRAGPPGMTLVSYRAGGEAGGEFLGRASVTVDRAHLSGVVVRVSQGRTMSGRVTGHPTTGGFARPAGDPPPQPRHELLVLEPADGDAKLGLPRGTFETTTPSAPFTIEGLTPGRYVVRAPGSLPILSVSWNGEEYADAALDASGGQDLPDVRIRLSRAADLARLEGSVTSERGEDVSQAAVLMFPLDPDLWQGYGLTPRRIHAARIDETGRYAFDSLLPGSYYVIAVDPSQAGRWRDPAFLRAAAQQATQVTLQRSRSETRVLPLQVVR